MDRAIIETYGCTLNQSDSDMAKSILSGEGVYVRTGKAQNPRKEDYVIINTCTVKKPTEQKILARLKSLSSQGCRIIVTGCMASANRDLILGAAPSASIISTSNMHRIGEALEEIRARGRVDYYGYSRIDKAALARENSGVICRIPISEGCLSSCSFCETKFARGPLNSFSDKLIAKAVEMAVGRGAKEIELTSQDVGAYGLDCGTDIAELLLDLSCIPGDFRIRVGMLNPEHLPKYFDRLISAFADRRIYRFVHLPLQSASNKVLRDMERGYTIEQFCGHLDELRSKVSGISIETDIIAGYPTESREDFAKSMDFIENYRPTFTNVSKFSMRPHAKASKLKQIQNGEVKARSSEMSRLARQVQHSDLSTLIGTTESVLITEETRRSITGRDDSYRIVAIPLNASGCSLGDRVKVRITGNTSVCLLGEICGQ